ncbi:MAG: hypothetical protein PHV02_10470 [Rhodocyclaceae bacterium]|nr:hypothetical protein [Rhodocyclaceae bacterium]
MGAFAGGAGRRATGLQRRTVEEDQGKLICFCCAYPDGEKTGQPYPAGVASKLRARRERDAMRKLESIYKKQCADLLEKIFFQAERMNIDLLEDGAIENLLAGADTGDAKTESDSWSQHQWARHFLSLAFRFLTDASGSATDEDKVNALCYGNWLVGVLSGIVSDGNDLQYQYQCMSCLIKQHSSAIGKAGAQKRHAPMAELRLWAIEKYQAGEWQSANQAAHALKEQVLWHGRAINAHLTEENAQRTIAEWFRKSV